MIFKKHRKIIIILIAIILIAMAGLFIVVGFVQNNVESAPDSHEDTRISSTLEQDNQLPQQSPTIKSGKSDEFECPMVPVVTTQVINESTDKIIEETNEPETNKYNISYIKDEDFDEHLLTVMKDFNVNLDVSYVYATIFCESSFRNAVESSVGAIGYMQVLPSTRDDIAPMIKEQFPQYSNLSKDLSDPYTNVVYGLFYFKYIANRFGESEVNENNINRILTCYNRGVTGGKRYFNSMGHWDSEYAKKIIRISEQIRTNGGM